MHCAQGVANQILAGLVSGGISSRALTSSEAATLAASLHDDARDAIYSAALSIAEAMQGLDRQHYSWTTVKLYYSIFYLALASLGLHGVGIIYPDKGTPYTWVANPGQTPIKRSGTTHKAVLDAFKLYRQNNILISQQIGVDEPFDWMMARRESVNYKTPKFCEPGAPLHFKFVERHGVRRLVGDYVSDESNLFTFDPDHAMLAYPVAGLKLLLSDLKASNAARLSPEDIAYLASQFFDRTGPLPELRRLLLS